MPVKIGEIEYETVDVGGTAYITVKEIATKLGVDWSAIAKAIKSGRITGQKILNRVLVLPEDLEASGYKPGSYGGVQRETIQRGPGRGEPRR